MEITIPEIIRKKRDRRELTAEEVNTFVEAVVQGSVSEAQTGAMLMAMFLNDLSISETLNLTKAMIFQGCVFRPGEDFSKNLLVDKHSTGGVGDKVSLILAPALAASGLKVPMMSGWSLDHTGGTLDKILSIPGFQVSLNPDQMRECLAKAGCFICAPTESFAPADAIFYKFRHATSTVDNHGLITSSILSKKAAEGIGVLVVDVKFGRGSFLKTEEEAKNLAEIMVNTMNVNIGNKLNLNVRVVISEMNAPLGRYVGNSLEVFEALNCLKNKIDNNLSELVKFLGGIVLTTTGLAETLEEGKTMISDRLKDGTALVRFKRMLRGQGVPEKEVEDLCSDKFYQVMPKAKHITALHALTSGTITELDALNIGRACRFLSEKRGTNEQQIDRSTGVVFLKCLGDSLKENEPWLEIHHSEESIPLEVLDLLASSLTVDPNKEPFKARITVYLYS